jgi:Holliday junction resolvasome RuvABC DNA-binding subunit
VNLQEQILLDYLKRYCPRMYRQMKAKGSLNEYVATQVRLADEQMEALLSQGFRDYEAREIVNSNLFPMAERDRKKD